MKWHWGSKGQVLPVFSILVSCAPKIVYLGQWATTHGWYMNKSGMETILKWERRGLEQLTTHGLELKTWPNLEFQPKDAHIISLTSLGCGGMELQLNIVREVGACSRWNSEGRGWTESPCKWQSEHTCFWEWVPRWRSQARAWGHWLEGTVKWDCLNDS